MLPSLPSSRARCLYCLSASVAHHRVRGELLVSLLPSIYLLPHRTTVPSLHHRVSPRRSAMATTMPCPNPNSSACYLLLSRLLLRVVVWCLATAGEVAVGGTLPVSDGLHFGLLNDIVGQNREPSWAGPFRLWIGSEEAKTSFSFSRNYE
jgi:hypothetical protein